MVLFHDAQGAKEGKLLGKWKGKKWEWEAGTKTDRATNHVYAGCHDTTLLRQPYILLPTRNQLVTLLR